MKTATATVSLLALLASAAAAQEVRIEQEGPQWGIGIGAHGRYSVPFGPADADISWIAGGGGAVIVIDENLSWAELFRPGWGVDAELDLFLGRFNESVFGPGGSFRYGLFAAVAVDQFEGDSETDGMGNRIEVDDLEMTTVLFGVKGISDIGDGSRMDARFALGAVHYSEVDAVFSSGVLGPVEAEFLDETWTLACEIRFQYGFWLGPVGLVMGFGFRTYLPPDEGEDVDFSAGLFFACDGSIGIEVAF